MWWHTRRNQISSIHLNRRGREFNRLLAAEVCASAVVMLDTRCSEVVWRVLAIHSIRQFPLYFPSRASPCAITFQLDSTSTSLPFLSWHVTGWPLSLQKDQASALEVIYESSGGTCVARLMTGCVWVNVCTVISDKALWRLAIYISLFIIRCYQIILYYLTIFLLVAFFFTSSSSAQRAPKSFSDMAYPEQFNP